MIIVRSAPPIVADAAARTAVPVVLQERYEVGPVLGAGGSAEVYRAWDRHARRCVAVKLFVTPCFRGHDHEVAVTSGFDHPGLVALHGAGTLAGRPFVVMDLVEGPSLREALRSGPWAPGPVADLGAGVADALAHVHERGVVHRDVKPGNVLLTRAGRPRLADFGLARVVDAARVTITGTIVGTAAYMAPEQVRGIPVEPPADIYSLGLVLLEAVTGRREYVGSIAESAVARLHRDPLVPTCLPTPFADVLVEMTAPEPAWRPDARSVAAALRLMA